tara:strand:- start:360 stop:575 length:216 start_codon:yes stop_codon:yes gene_type:complete
MSLITLRNGLLVSAAGFETINHLTGKMDKGSLTRFDKLPDIFYKELQEDDRTVLNTIEDETLSVILERTRT